MNKLLLLVITMVMALGGSNAFALGSSRMASYQGQTSYAITSVNSPVVLDTRGGVIYNITLNATSAGSATLTVYDQNALSNGQAGPEQVIYEVEVATAGDSRSVDFSTAPLNTYTGITASVTNGVGYLNIQQ